MARGKPHDDQTKAAVMAALLAGQSVSDVARQFKVSRNTVKAWRQATGLNSPVVDQQKREELGDLVGNLLRTILATLQVQAEQQFRDKAWLSRQPASELAVLFGVLADKGFRILEAAEAASGDEAPPADPQ